MSGKTGLFGGTFDPPHNGHLHIARAFADETGLDTVIFLPAGDPYHKSAPCTPAAHRLAMTELAAAADPRFAVSDLDIVRGGATYTADTVQIFRQHFPAGELWWLMGADSLAGNTGKRSCGKPTSPLPPAAVSASPPCRPNCTTGRDTP